MKTNPDIRTAQSRFTGRRQSEAKAPAKSSCEDRRHLVAFTLIELLTVIAIIGILAGITIPTVSKVRISARRVDSTARLRNLHTAVMLYANDYKNFIIANYQTTPASEAGTWFFKLIDRGYLNVPKGTDYKKVTYFGCDQQLKLTPLITTSKATFGLNAYFGSVDNHNDTWPLYFHQIATPAQTHLISHGITGSDSSTEFNAGVDIRLAPSSRGQPVFGNDILVCYADGHVKLVPIESVPDSNWKTTEGKRFWLGQ